MSLLGHLVRATLTPEQAAQPALPQQFANWRAADAADAADDVEWCAPGVSEASPLAPYAEPVHADPLPARSRPTDLKASAEMPRPAVRALPEPSQAELAPFAPAPPRRAAEPIVEAAPTPSPAIAKTPAEATASHQSAPRHSETGVGETPSLPSRAERAEPVTPPAPESIPAKAAAQPSSRVTDAAAGAASVAGESPRAVAPEIARALVAVVPRPARHDPAAPAKAGALPSAPELPRDPPRRQQPRGAAPVTREAMAAASPPPAAAPVAPDAPPPSAAAPVLTVPQVMPPEPVVQPQLPDVHISIGRVEVRAAGAPPAPPPREAGRKAEPLSLDAYLNRRNGTAR
ncbi:hypothetical protein E5A73_16290 [Sphingomonas gei]|uniref:Uncharacterized protein n=1 Tax=Sphingomonas gei TaxID=1395960 RepID=A0A4V3QZ09_9SPHN|nr:hypothetical protein [Sphingomonas gei]TGX52352.1 hypothetical protein E5A73_16290 [Sphingomonas gei]